MDQKGHPLPASDEARHDEIPEHVEREKGHGADARKLVQPGGKAAEPDGTHYQYHYPTRCADRDNDDQASMDRGQGIAEEEAED